jgi:hypothetical protein
VDFWEPKLKRLMGRQDSWLVYGTVALFFLSALACVAGGSGFSTPPLAGEAFAVCATATPVPTVMFTIPIGTSTPVPHATPPVVGTPVYEIGFTTPVPTETPYYRVETFYGSQLVHIDNITLELTGWTQAADPDHEAMAVYSFTFRVGNYIGDGQLFPLSQLLFIRRVVQADGHTLLGRWTANPEHTGHIELEPMGFGAVREYEIAIGAPEGQVTEIGLVSSWQSPLAGGVPIWFLTDLDPTACGYWWVNWGEGDEGPPPRPTPAIIGLGGGPGGSGICGWPTTGTLMRGFGCSSFPTGITNPMGCFYPAPYFHNGLDIAAATGTAIVAPISGHVTAAGYDDVRGNYVWVESDVLGERHDLLHMESVFVQAGQQVTAGQAVGTVGSTGNSSGPHLHWTVRRNLVLIDPATWNGCVAGGVEETDEAVALVEK